MRYSINLIWSEEDKAYLAAVPELPGCFADGATPEEALRNIQVVTEEWVETAKDINRTVPEPVDVARAHQINQQAVEQAQKQFEELRKSIAEQLHRIQQEAQNPRLSGGFTLSTRPRDFEPA